MVEAGHVWYFMCMRKLGVSACIHDERPANCSNMLLVLCLSGLLIVELWGGCDATSVQRKVHPLLNRNKYLSFFDGDSMYVLLYLCTSVLLYFSEKMVGFLLPRSPFDSRWWIVDLCGGLLRYILHTHTPNTPPMPIPYKALLPSFCFPRWKKLYSRSSI